MIDTGRIKLTAIRRSYGKASTGENVPAYEIHFTIDQQGDYVATVPISGYSREVAMKAIALIAEPIIETIDMLK